jgi:ribonuclease Z
MDAPWHVSDIYPDRVCTTRFELQEAFAVAHDEGCVNYERTIIDAPAYQVNAITMDHHTPVIAYVVREKARHNIDPARLEKSGLPPGPWMQRLKEIHHPEDEITIQGADYSLGILRRELLIETPGDAVAYLTDFLMDESAVERLAEFLKGCDTVVCEGQYRHADLELAHRHFHMTTVLSAQLAKRVAARRLILIHLSRRYQQPEWLEMLREAREWFPAAEFPPRWEMG